MTNPEATYQIELCDDPEQASIVSALGAETFTETFGHLYKSEDLEAFVTDSHGHEGYVALLKDPSYRVWLAKDEKGEAVGYSVAGPSHLPAPDMKPNSGELVRLYVLGKCQGARLGQRLLEPALEWLSANFDEVYLSVYAENIGAQRLYKRYGFEIIHKYSFMVGNQADPEFIMKRIEGLQP